MASSVLFNRRVNKITHSNSMIGSPFNCHRSDSRRGSTSSDASTGSDESQWPVMSDENVALLLLSLSNDNTPFTTPSPHLSGLPSADEDDETEDDSMSESELPESSASPPVLHEPIPVFTPTPEPSPQSSSDAVSPSKVARSQTVNRKKSKTAVKGKPKAKSDDRAKIKAKAKSVSPSPQFRINVVDDRLAEGVYIADLSPEDQESVLARPKRDQKKAESICRYRMQPNLYYEIFGDERCDRCISSDWACFKKVPQKSNNKPGPAPGHGAGCATCHKSACSFATKEREEKARALAQAADAADAA